jgi:DNA-binding phage protein
MVKAKISPKQKKSSQNLYMKLKNHPDLTIHDPIKNLTDEKFIGQAIMECLLNNDPEGVMEVIQIYVDALEKTQFIEASDVPKSTLYHSLRSKNPTIKTLAKLMHATTLESRKSR